MLLRGLSGSVMCLFGVVAAYGAFKAGCTLGSRVSEGCCLGFCRVLAGVCMKRFIGSIRFPFGSYVFSMRCVGFHKLSYLVL